MKTFFKAINHLAKVIFICFWLFFSGALALQVVAPVHGLPIAAAAFASLVTALYYICKIIDKMDEQFWKFFDD